MKTKCLIRLKSNKHSLLLISCLNPSYIVNVIPDLFELLFELGIVGLDHGHHSVVITPFLDQLNGVVNNL